MVEKVSTHILNNARLETIKEKPTYHKNIQHMRCLIPASGFYEWKTEGKMKTPYYTALKEWKLFAFAGIYSIVKDSKGKDLKSCSIITMPPNSLMAKIHERMPMILPKGLYDEWIDPKITDMNTILGMINPIESKEMRDIQVSTMVNAIRNNSEKNIEPIGD